MSLDHKPEFNFRILVFYFLFDASFAQQKTATLPAAKPGGFKLFFEKAITIQQVEPNVITDANGEATIRFTNASQETQIKIIAEGITARGVAVTGKTIYVVK